MVLCCLDWTPVVVLCWPRPCRLRPFVCVSTTTCFCSCLVPPAIARRNLLPVAQCISIVKTIEAALQSHVATIASSIAAILRDHASQILSVIEVVKVGAHSVVAMGST